MFSYIKCYFLLVVLGDIFYYHKNEVYSEPCKFNLYGEVTT